VASVFTNPGEIRSDESRSWWLTVAGAAAALAASMTVLVAPIDGAFASPPTSNVIVVNPVRNPR
jgi:hypothetical protein